MKQVKKIRNYSLSAAVLAVLIFSVAGCIIHPDETIMEDGIKPLEESSYVNAQELKPGENKVSYVSDGMKLSALLYLPEDYKEGEKRPVIVIPRIAR